VLEWKTPEDRDEKTRSSCITYLYLDRRDDEFKMTRMKGPSAKCQDESEEKNGPEPAQKGPRPIDPFESAQPVVVPVRTPLSSVLSMWNPNRVVKPPFFRDAI
jgi:hypothetical protein